MEISTQIIQRALELFLKYGAKSITMDELALQLGMSKKTIYQYFEDKNKLVSECVQLYTGQHQVECCNIYDNTDLGIEAFLVLSKMGLKRLKSINPTLLFDLQKYYPDAWGVFMNFRNNIIKTDLKKVIQKGIDQGYFRVEIDAEIIAQLHLAHIDLVIDPELHHKTEISREIILEQSVDILLRGIATDSGLNYLNSNYTKIFTK